MLDITAAQQALILALVHQRLPHVTTLAFGSRAIGWPFGRGSKPYSDLDIAVRGLRAEDAATLAHLRADLEESTLPWRVDISDEKDLSPPLRALIEQHGVLLQGNLEHA